MSAKNWIFTHNGSSRESYNSVTTRLRDGGLNVLALRYICFQLECGEAGNIHEQGYCQFSTRKSFKQAKDLIQDLFPDAHIEKAKGSAQQCKEYCTKEDTRIEGPYEQGLMMSAGKRSDIKEFYEALPLTEDEMYDRFPEIVAKYPRFIRQCTRRFHRPQPIPFYPTSGWQLDLVSYLGSPTHPRKVRWYIDLTGNNGKSFFASNYGGGLGYVVTGGKHADIFYAYAYQPVVFFDWPRSHQEAFPYGVVESFKNGYFLSTKYESVCVKFHVPHVIIFANFAPDMTQLSQDRWDIINI